MQEKAAVIYWSATGNTEKMAEAIAEGLKEANVPVEIFQVSEFGTRMIGDYSRIAFGCPSMGAEVLEESDFDPFFTSIEPELVGKKIALFGSYGWGNGEWMADWESRAKNDGAQLFGDKGLIINLTPDDAGIAECAEFGKKFAAF